MSYNLPNYNLDERLILEKEIIAYILTFDQNLRMKNEFQKHGIDDSKYFFSTIYGYMFEAAKNAWSENIETDVLSIIIHRSRDLIDKTTDLFKNYHQKVIDTSMYFCSLTNFDYKMFMFKQYILMDYINEFSSNNMMSNWSFRDVLLVHDNYLNGYNQLFDKLTRNFKSNSNSTIVDKLKENFEKAQSGKNPNTLIGLNSFDRWSGGLISGELMIIAARPSMGKTSFVLSLANNMGFKLNIKVMVLTLEMTKQVLINKLASSHLNIEYQRIRSYQLSKDEFDRLVRFYELFEGPNAKILIFDKSEVKSIQDFRTKVEELKPDIAIVDYLQLMVSKTGNSSSKNRQEEVSFLSRELKSICLDTSIPIIALSQLSRAVDSRTNKRPILSDLRESGAIEQDADIVGFLYRESYYKEQADPNYVIPLCEKGNTEFNIAKGRDIGTKTFFINLALTEYTIYDCFLHQNGEQIIQGRTN